MWESADTTISAHPHTRCAHTHGHKCIVLKICALRQMVVMVDIITDVKRSVHSKTYWCIGGSLQGALLLKPKAPACVHAGGPACMRVCKREREQEREMKVRGVKRMIVLLFKLSEFHHWSQRFTWSCCALYSVNFTFGPLKHQLSFIIIWTLGFYIFIISADLCGAKWMKSFYRKCIFSKPEMSLSS